MKIRIPKICIFLIIFLCSVSAIWGQTPYIWTGEDDINGNGDWSIGNNWAQGVPPGSGDNAVIFDVTPYPAPKIISPAEVNKITIESNGSLLVSADTVVHGDMHGDNTGSLTISNGIELIVAGSWTYLGGLDATGSAVKFAGDGSITTYGASFGNVAIDSGANYQLMDDLSLDGALENNGNLNLNGNNIHAGSVTNFESMFANDATITTDIFYQTGGTISSTGDLTLEIDTSASQSSGDISVTETLILSGAGSYDLSQSSNRVGSLTTNGTGTGSISFTNSSAFTVTGLTSSGSITLSAGTNSITVTNDITSGESSSIDFSSPVELDDNPITITCKKGAVTFSSTVDGDQNLTIENDTGNVTFEDSVGATTAIGTGTGTALAITGSGKTIFEGTIETSSGISLSGAVDFYDDITIAAGDTSTNIEGDVTIYINTNDNVTIEAGQHITLESNLILGGTGTGSKAVINTTDNDGRISISGSVSGSKGLDLTTDGTGEISIEGYVELDGTLTLKSDSGDISIAGTVTLGGALRIQDLAAGKTFTAKNTIDAAGGVNQTGSDGTNHLYGNVSTTDTDISFASPLVLHGSSGFTFNSSDEQGGDITLAGLSWDDEEKALTVIAGTGDVSLADIGTDDPDWFSSVTITGDDVTLNGDIYSKGPIKITAAGTILNGGTIYAGPGDTGNLAISFIGDYKTDTSGTLIGNSTKTSDIEFYGDAVFLSGSITQNENRLIFKGAARDQIFNPGKNVYDGDIIINKTDTKNNPPVSNKVTVDGYSVTQTTGNLKIIQGSLDLGSLGWLIDSSTGSYSPIIGFYGKTGDLTLGDAAAAQDALLICPGFKTDSGFTITIDTTDTQRTKTISSSQGVTIDNGTTTNALDTVDFVMTGNGTFTVDANASTAIGSLTVESGIIILGAALSVKNDISILGGSLDVSINNWGITLGESWSQYSTSAFVYREGTVRFNPSPGSAICIQGSTQWWNFVCETASRVTIKFARNNDKSTKDVQHIFHNEFKVISESSSSSTLLTKMLDTDYRHDTAAPLGGNDVPGTPPGSEDRFFFWNITIGPGASVDLENVTVNYSWADQAILLPDSIFTNVDATPYSQPLSQAHYCVGWTKTASFVYSFTEDENHNGRIDRIRVQTSVPFTGSFDSGFKIEVVGYKVTGYDEVSGYNNMFYIYLEEKPYVDGGNTLTWRLVDNYSIIDAETRTEYFDTVEPDMHTVNTTWPVINYSLMLPKSAGARQQLYIQFSEPVSAFPASEVKYDGTTVFYGEKITPPPGDGTYFSECLVEFNSNSEVSIADMAAAKTYTIITSVTDQKNSFPDTLIQQYPIPLYPHDESYSVYDLYDNNPAELLNSNTSRITDVLISIPPDGSSIQYFAWPVTAMDKMAFIEPFKSIDQDRDRVVVTKFDGSGTLRDTDITLDVLVNPNFSTTSLDLIAGISVPSSYKGTSANGSPGLWLTYKSGLVPEFYPAAKTKQYAGIPSSGRASYTISENDYGNNDVVDFYFTTLGSADLLAGRLDIAAGASVPSDWYRRIKPFTFSVKEMTLQRGGATILNNVINPTKGEKTYLNYTLTKSGQVTVQVFTMDGTLVQVLYRDSRPAGEHVESWDGKNRGGRVVARGMYFIRIVAPDIDEIRKVMVVK